MHQFSLPLVCVSMLDYLHHPLDLGVPLGHLLKPMCAPTGPGEGLEVGMRPFGQGFPRDLEDGPGVSTPHDPGDLSPLGVQG